MAIYHMMLNYVIVLTFACIVSVLSQYYPLTTPEPKGPFDVRLVDGPSKAEGRLEVLIDNTWGTVCDTSFSTFHGDLVCKQLGYDGALYVNKSAAYGPGDGPTWISYFYNCPEGTESSLWQCRYDLADKDWHYCSHHKHDVGVGCFHLKDGEIPVRLYDRVDHSFRKLHNAGTVEVFYNGSWSFICSHGRSTAKWGLKEADVVCKELNYKRATSVTFDDGWYVPQRKFVISSVQCRGNEDTIAECDITATGTSNDCKASAYSQYAAVVVCSKTEGDLSSGKIGGIVMICIISIVMFITIPALIFITRKRKQTPGQANPQEVTPVMHSGTQPYQDIS